MAGQVTGWRGALALDVGTARTRAWLSGRGVVVDEPTVLAYDDAGRRVRAVGRTAAAAVDGQVRLVRPVRRGVTVDVELAGLLVHRLLGLRARFAGSVVVSVPVGATAADRQAVDRLVRDATAARHVEVVDAARSVASGVGLGGRPLLVVDVGAGLTEVSVVAGHEVVAHRVLAWGTADLEASVLAELCERFGLAATEDEVRRALHTGLVTGRDVRSGEVRVARLTNATIDVAGGDVLDQIATAAAWLHAECAERPTVLLVGGGARVPVIRTRLCRATGAPVRTGPDPTRAVVTGLARLAEPAT